MLLIIPVRETNVGGVGEASHLEANTIPCCLTTVLALPCVERPNVDHRAIKDDAEVVRFSLVPAVNLIKVKLEDQLPGVSGDMEYLGRITAAVVLAVPSEESSEA